MRSYNCTPVSYPSLPTCYQHPMWQAWDLALDHIIGQLPVLLDGKAKVAYEVGGCFLVCQWDCFFFFLITVSSTPYSQASFLPNSWQPFKFGSSTVRMQGSHPSNCLLFYRFD